MEQAVWDEKFNIGVEVIDKAHAKLFRIVKKLLDISEDAKANQHAYKEGIKYLETYTMKHFSEEEAYMRSIRYGAYGQHKRIHDNFRDKTPDFPEKGYGTVRLFPVIGPAIYQDYEQLAGRTYYGGRPGHCGEVRPPQGL